ncbi:ribonuclease H1/H2 small subunit [Acephala macrosclerotiorum]|nr:ribonuclease H1/H2 small subunit [Acephala macrosclerotiorum]
MLAIERKSTGHEGKCTPNVLPCRINHNGPVDASKRYWNPTQTPDGKTTAYFRGKKLYGKQVKVPEGYRGVVLSSTDRILPKPAQTMEHDEDAEEEPEVKIVEEQSDFDSIMVWGHEAVPEDAADPYVKGMDEWIAFSEQIHSYKTNNSSTS